MARPRIDEARAMGSLRGAITALEEASEHAAAELEEAQLACTHSTDGKRLSLAEDALLRAAADIGSASRYVSIIERAQARRRPRVWQLMGETDGVRVGVDPSASGDSWTVYIDKHPARALEERNFTSREALERFVASRFGESFCRGLLACGLPELGGSPPNT